MKTLYQYIFILLFTGLLAVTGHSQKSLGLPEAFENPIDYWDSGEDFVKKKLFENTSNKMKDKPWIVFSDRDNNYIYEKPDLNTRTKKTIKFGELFYVVDEEEGWIEIVKGRRLKKTKIDVTEKLGWVPKENMLLWNYGLIDKNTKINRKAILLKRADNIKEVLRQKLKGDDENVEFYNDPNRKYPGKQKKVYDVYFVLKKENGMYLLSEESEISGFSAEDGTLLGWANANQLQEWNTRICLEPNFNKEAFTERKNDPEKRCVGFGDSEQIIEYYDEKLNIEPVWNFDPARILNGIGDSEFQFSRRDPGDVMRFPLFGKSKIDNTNFYRSGTIGEIKALKKGDGSYEIVSEMPEISMARMQGRVAELSAKNDQMNLFFLIEGTRDMYGFKAQIVDLISKIQNNESLLSKGNVRYGALIYRDSDEGENIVEFTPLSSDIQTTIDFLTNVDFDNKIDQDEHTNLRYGIKKAMNIAGFDNNSINTIIAIGNNGDFMYNKIRRNNAKVNDPYFISGSDFKEVYNKLADFDCHISAIQLDRKGTIGDNYGRSIKQFALESAKIDFNQIDNSSTASKVLSKHDDLKIIPPEMEDPRGKTKSVLKGYKPARIIMPYQNEQLSPSLLMASANKIIDDVVEYENAMLKIFNNVLNSGEELDIGTYSKDVSLSVPQLSSGILKFLDNTKINLDVSDKELLMATDENLVVFVETYFPAIINGSNHNLLMPQLFMPERDLRDYADDMNRWYNKVNLGSPSDRREALYDLYIEMIGRLGQDIFKGQDANSVSAKRIANAYQGISDEGIDFDVYFDKPIGLILDEKEFSDEQVDELIGQIRKVGKSLEKITSLGENYKGCYTSAEQNRYFWIDMRLVTF